MIQTWFKIFFRNSKKNWLNMVVNMLGLTLGFAGLLIVLLYLNDEHRAISGHENNASRTGIWKASRNMVGGINTVR